MECCTSTYISSLTDLSSFSRGSVPRPFHQCPPNQRFQLFTANWARSPHKLFRDYAYVSGTTQTLDDFFDWFANRQSDFFNRKIKVLDIASNDGSLLTKFKKRGHEVLGIDPAANLIEAAALAGIPTVCDYWPGEISGHLKNHFDIVVAMNVLAHVPNPLEFLVAIRDSAMSELGGKILVQTSQANMVPEGQFDTCYHEHISFFSVRSMSALCERAGLRLTQVERVPVHGESYLWTIEASSAHRQPSVDEYESREDRLGVYDAKSYEDFEVNAKGLVSRVQAKINSLRDSGLEIWAYGAAAKANTFINYAGLSAEGVFDDNPLKQGLVSPGGSTKVYDSQHLRNLDGKLAIICTAWNFLPEIASRIRNIRGHGNDLMLTYFPDVETMTVDQACGV